MTTTLLFSNILAWIAQIAVIIAIGAAAALALSPGRARLIFWQGLLAVVLLLPALQPWLKPEMFSNATVAVTTSTFTTAPVPHSQPSFTWRTEYLLYVMLAGAAFRMMWILVGFVRLRGHRLAAREIAEPPVPFEKLGVRWYVSDTISGPVTFGWLRPAILLPTRVCQLPADLREAIACHELVHVRRADWLFVLAEEAIRGLFWFHPAVWFALSQIQLAREQTVDAEVVALLSNRDRYLDALVAVAAQRLYPDVAPAPLFLKKRQLAVRVAAVLKETRMSKPRLVASCATVSSAALVAVRLAVGLFPLHSPSIVNAQTPQAITQTRPMDGPGIEVDAGGPLMHRTGVYRPETSKTTGSVVLDLSLNSKGEVNDARVVSGPDDLRKSALQSVLGWHYSTDGGAAATVRATIHFGATPEIQRNIPTAARMPAPANSVMAPAKLQFIGVSPEVEQKVRARLPIHDGDQITSASMPGILAAAKEVDDHFMVSIGFNNGLAANRTGAPVEAPQALVRLILAPAAGAIQAAFSNEPPVGGVSGGVVSGVLGGVQSNAVEGAPVPQRIRVGENVQLANLIRRVQPEYPPLAKQARIQGVVHFTVIISKDGSIQHIEVISGHPLLVPAALEAVKQWVYKPTLLNNQPVEVITQVDVNFTLSEEPPQ